MRNRNLAYKPILTSPGSAVRRQGSVGIATRDFSGWYVRWEFAGDDRGNTANTRLPGEPEEGI